MFRSAFKMLLVCGLVLVASVQNVSLGAEPLRYKWKPAQKFGYEVTITADHSTKIDTYKGSLLYEVKAVDGETVRLVYGGGVTGSSKKKGSEEAAKLESYTAEMFQGLKQMNTDLVLNTRGQVVEMKADTQLPYMLGNLSILVFEAVPETDPSGWSVQGGVGITEKKESNRNSGFGPPTMFGPRSGFGPRGFGGSNIENGKTSAATTAEQFKLKSETAGKIVYEKTFSLKSPGEEAINIEGTGTWTFNRDLGLSDSLDFSQKISVNKGNVSINIPVTIAFRSLTSQEYDKVQNEWLEIARKQKEAHEKFWAEHNQKKEEAKRIAETPLTPEETAAALAALKPAASIEDLKKTLATLKTKSLKSPDPAIVEAIRPHLKHNDKAVRMAAEDAMAQWNPEYKKKYDVFVKYRGRHGTWEGSGRTVDAKTPLVVGQLLLAKWQLMWDNAEVLELLPDGQVHIQVYGSPFKAKLPRERLQLAHVEVDQPDEVQRRLDLANGSPVMRTWTDSTGQFKIEAVLLSLNGDTIKLKRKDGRELELPLTRLSAEDQAFAKQPVKRANPFE